MSQYCPNLKSDCEAEIARLTEENKELKDLFNLQHTRTAKADKLWQKAFNEPNTLPDLGQLIDWMLSENSRLRDALQMILEDYHNGISANEVYLIHSSIAKEALASPPKDFDWKKDVWGKIPDMPKEEKP